MSKHTLLFTCATLASACATSLFTGCGSSSNGNNPGGTDSGTTKDSSSTVDTGMMAADTGSNGDDGGGDSSSTEGGGGCNLTKLPSGTQLVKQAGLVVEGITDDGNVIYYDTKAMKLYAVAVAGGTPTLIGGWDNSGYIYTGGNAVFYWNGVTQKTAPEWGKLSVWTAAQGNKVLGTKEAYVGWIEISKDGNSIIWTDNAATTGGDVYVSALDGTGAVKLATAVPYPSTTSRCGLDFKFIGNTAVNATCVTPEAGTALTTITGYSGTGWATTQTFTTTAPLSYFAGSDDGTMIVFPDATGTLVQTIGAASPTVVDPTPGLGIFTHSGTDIIYLADTTGVLYRAPITGGTGDGGTGDEINAGPFGQFLVSSISGLVGAQPALSSDDRWVMLYTSASTSVGGLSDVWITSTAAGSTAKHLVTATTGALMGDAFTFDNKFSTYYSNVTMQGVGIVGDYDALSLPTTGGTLGMPKDFAMLVWQNFSGAAGSKTIYNNNYAAGSNNGTADIQVADLSATPITPALQVSGADANIYMTKDRSKIVYTYNQAAPCTGQGLWALPTP